MIADRRPRKRKSSSPLRIFIVGGGIMALTAATELFHLSRKLGMRLIVRLFEAGAFGGGPFGWSAAPRCQLWWHNRGTIYCQSQPATALALQQSARRYRQLVPHAFRRTLSFAIAPVKSTPPDEFFRILNIQHQPVPRSVFCHWFPMIELPYGFQVYRVNDGTIDLPLLGQGLAAHACRNGATLIRRRVRNIRVHGDHISALELGNGESVSVGAHDVVILTCGSRIRPLLGDAGITVPGLRLFKSHLICSDRFQIPALLAVLSGGVNCVPHPQSDGRLMNIFGNSFRTELPAEADRGPVTPHNDAVMRLRQEVEQAFGLRVPEDCFSWPAVKTEIVPLGNHSQAYHARLVPGLTNGWLALPGKLSQAPACAADLAARILRPQLGRDIATPIWEQEDTPSETFVG